MNRSTEYATDIDDVDSVMTTNPSNRLDRIEAILDRLAERQIESDSKIDRLIVGQQQTQNQIDALLALYDGLEQRLEQERNQAEIDRREFRSTVDAVLDALRDRFTSNGGA